VGGGDVDYCYGLTGVGSWFGGVLIVDCQFEERMTGSSSSSSSSSSS